MAVTASECVQRPEIAFFFSQASQPLDDVAFLGGSGEELEIPEESVRELQNVKVCDQYHRETTGDFLDSDALRLMEEHAEKKHTKSKSRAHRKARRYNQRKKEDKLKGAATADSDNKGATDNTEGATDNNNDHENEITKYLLGATNLAKPRHQEYQMVLEDIREVNSSRNSDGQDDQALGSDDSVTAVIDLPTDSSHQDENVDTVRKEKVQDCTLSFPEETEWEELCEKIQNYTFDGDN